MSSYGLRRRSLFGSANDYRSHRAGLPRARLFPEPAFVRPGIRFGQFVEFNIDTGNVVRVGGGRQKRIFWRRRWTARRRRTFLTTQGVRATPTALCRRTSFRAWRWGDHRAMPWIRPSMVFGAWIVSDSSGHESC